jgi:hypothetical protein
MKAAQILLSIASSTYTFCFNISAHKSFAAMNLLIVELRYEIEELTYYLCRNAYTHRAFLSISISLASLLEILRYKIITIKDMKFNLDSPIA